MKMLQQGHSERFQCYKDRCISGEEFCYVIIQLCVRCANFLDRCFTDRHISNCTDVCTNHLQSVTEILTTGMHTGVTDTSTPTYYEENGQNSTPMYLPVLLVISVLLLVGGLLLAVSWIRRGVTRIFDSVLNRVCSGQTRRADSDETELKSTNADFHPIHSDTSIDIDSNGRIQNSTGYERLHQNGDFGDQTSHPTNVPYERFQSSRGQGGLPIHQNSQPNVHTALRMPIQESQALIYEQPENHPSHGNELSQETLENSVTIN